MLQRVHAVNACYNNGELVNHHTTSVAVSDWGVRSEELDGGEKILQLTEEDFSVYRPVTGEMGGIGDGVPAVCVSVSEGSKQ